ncbi:M48 family metalloprotease, partial [Candidatus Micrarchaeota archaeon]|nr:M48 family metalloprotease [Candidatus Micrarchaeota archaeon]
NLGARTFLWTGGSRNRREGGGALAIIGLVFLILAPIFAMLVRLAVSRQREYLADATAAKLTRYPEGLASALEKIGKSDIPTRNANDTTASLYISNPFPGRMNLFATHPPIKERVEKLRSM